MNRKLVAMVVLTAPLLLCSCTIRHVIQSDYSEYLAKNTGTANLPKTDKASEYALTTKTQEFSYEFRAFLTGQANLWVVDIGKMLEDTLKSSDVQAAFGSLKKSESQATANGLLTFDLQSYAFEHFKANISLKVSYSQAGKVVFEKIYTKDGANQTGKMVAAGVFGQKNAVQQSTKLAIDAILRDLITDLNSQTGSK